MKKAKNEPGNAVVSSPKKKRRIGVPLLFLVIVLLIGSAGGYYYYERQKPQKAMDKFMDTVLSLDFDQMIPMIQTEDLSVLDHTDIRNSAYTDFFRAMCKKITYEIVKTRFNLMNGTADLTVRINYVDGSEIYKSASSEFIRQIAAASFAGTEMSEEELKEVLADTLMKAQENTEPSFLVTEITYPMISIDNVWKITNLDNETLKVMSSNFSSVEQEFEESVAAAQTGKQISMDTPIDDSDLIDMDTERFRIHYTQFRLTKDISDQPCLLVYYEYTNNNTDTASCPMFDINLQAFQNGVALDAAIPETTEDALDFYMSEVSPAQTVTVCQAFSLIDTSDVSLKASDAFTFGGDVTSQLLKIQ